jgi:hypothetical protein
MISMLCLCLMMILVCAMPVKSFARSPDAEPSPGASATTADSKLTPTDATSANSAGSCKVRADQRLDEDRSNPAMTKAPTEGRSATVMPCAGVRTSNVGPSTGPLTSTQITAAATRPTATNLRRRGDDSLENGLVTGKC